MNRCDVVGKEAKCAAQCWGECEYFVQGETMCQHYETRDRCNSLVAIRAAIEAENGSCVDCKYNDVEYDSFPCRMCRECYTKSFFEKAEVQSE